MNLLESIMEWYPEDTFGLFDGFDEAIIGVDSSTNRIIYSQSKIMNILIEKQDMSDEEAYDYYDFNIATLYFGENTPIICNDTF
jgi:hypothetical protein